MKYRYREPHEMKDSGVEWLGMIPREWEVSKLKYVSKIITGNTPLTSVKENYENGFIEWVKPNNILENFKLSEADQKLSFIGLEQARLIPKDSTIVCCIGTIGKTAFTEKEITTNQQINSINFIKINKKYGFYKIIASREEHKKKSNMVVVSILNKENQSQIQIAIPKLNDQQKIADFLDLKCGEFNSIIEKKESLITKLEEAKKSLISEVVTGKVKVIEKENGSYEIGKREPHEMKDSGVEWLGMIPREWEVKKIKHLSNIGRGASPRPIDDPKYFDENGEYAWTRIADVTSSGKYLLETTQKMSKLGASLSIKLEPGNIFISIAGSVGKPCITRIKACIHDGFIYFHNLDKKYYNLLYHIFTIGQCYAGLGKLGTQLNLNRETIGNILIALPTDNSEERISDYIDLKCSQFDSTIEKQKELIEKLKKAKQSLISEAVTGKIEVLTNIS